MRRIASAASSAVIASIMSLRKCILQACRFWFEAAPACNSRLRACLRAELPVCMSQQEMPKPFRQGADSEAGSGWRTASDSDDGGGASDMDASGNVESGPAPQQPNQAPPPGAPPAAGSAPAQGAAMVGGVTPVAAAEGPAVEPERPGPAPGTAGAAADGDAAALRAERRRQLLAEGAKIAAAHELLYGLLRSGALDASAQVRRQETTEHKVYCVGSLQSWRMWAGTGCLR